jgi:thymidylate synthase ThyX
MASSTFSRRLITTEETSMSTLTGYPLRVYPMDPQELTEEQIAVIFAMTSRRPEPFDEIRHLVTAEKAADFHERWVLNYGHASVAEHAVIHMAVENLSRLACDTLEDNRLASYTEKSSRYQVFSTDYYHVPQELDQEPPLRQVFLETCQRLFGLYEEMVESLRAHLRTVRFQGPEEREGGYNLRLRKEATDTCRFVLPAATLTNVGMTLNARSMEHAIRKLLSAELAEEQALGELLKREGRRVTPTLIKYADRNQYLVKTRQAQEEAAESLRKPVASAADAALVHYDPEAEVKVATAFLYRFSHRPYNEVLDHVRGLSSQEREGLIDGALQHLGGHDVPIRELETAYYTFELILDYGAYREFKRHRMQTYVPQPATTALGYVTPPLIEEAELHQPFQEAMRVAEEGFQTVAQADSGVAQYLVTHAHRRRVMASMNLRECYHLFKLRTQPTAHFSLVEVMSEALERAREVHPSLFKHLRLRAEE